MPILKILLFTKLSCAVQKKKKKSQFHTSLKLLREAPVSPKTQK